MTHRRRRSLAQTIWVRGPSTAILSMSLLCCAGGGGGSTQPDAIPSGDLAVSRAADQVGSSDATAGSDTARVMGTDAADSVGSDDTADGAVARPQPRPTRQWTPQYPGQVFGCSSTDGNDPTTYQCFLRIYPESPVIALDAACDEDETPHTDTCPSTSYTGKAIATCQELPTPKPTAENPNFEPFFAYVVYEAELLQLASLDPDPVAKCKELVASFPDPFCPPDAVMEYKNPQSVDCSVLAKK